MNQQISFFRNFSLPALEIESSIWLFLTILCSFLSSYAVTNLSFKSGCNLEITLGWLLALIFNFTGLMIKLFAVGRRVRSFFVCMFLLVPLNAVMFLCAAFFLIHFVPLNAKPFITSIFSTYFILVVYDVFRLRSLGLKTGVS